VQPSGWATWLLERDDCAARAWTCGMQLACSCLANWQWPVHGMAMGVSGGEGVKTIIYVIPIKNGFAANLGNISHSLLL